MPDAFSFEAKLARLKECAQVREDQEVADLLGLTKAAFSARKQRDSFPDDKLFRLAVDRPNLEIDVFYVLTGDRLVQGRSRQAIESQARFLGAMPLADESSNELMSTIAFEGAKHIALLRTRRQATYDSILSALDSMSDASVGLLLALAERLEVADVHQSLRKAREAAREAARANERQAEPVSPPPVGDAASSPVPATVAKRRRRPYSR